MIPYYKGVLIKKIEKKEGEMVDGVFMPASARGDTNQRGVVVEVGQSLDGKLAIGDKIIYEDNAMSVIENGEELFLIKESQIKVIL